VVKAVKTVKAVLVSGEYPPAQGGVADYTFHLAHALAALGHAVSVVTSTGSSGEAHGAGASPTVGVYRSVRAWGVGGLGFVNRVVGALSPDVVNFQYVPHLYGRGGLAPAVALLPLLLRRTSGATVVGTVHEVAVRWSVRPRRAVQAAAHRLQVALLALGCDRLVVTNPRYAADMRRRAGSRAIVHEIPVGANIVPARLTAEERRAARRSLGAARGVLLGTLSPLGPGRRAADLVTVLGALGPSARLALLGGLAGHQCRRGLIMDPAAESGVADRIAWTGFLPPADLSRCLASLDVYIHTQDVGASTRSTALVAALAHGLPVVAYRGPETSELFIDGENILLVPRGDVRALADGVRQVLDSPRLAARLAAGGHDLYVQRFTWESIARRFLDAAA